MIQAVFFDLYETLVRWDPPREKLQAAACGEFDIRVEPAGLRRGYAAADALLSRQNAASPVRRMTLGERATFFAEYEQVLLEGAGVQVSRELAGRIFARLRQFSYDLVLYEDVLPAMALLRDRDLTLGLITNYDRDAEALIQALGLAPYLDFVVTSVEADVEKPHPPIFLLALERAGVEPHEALHVGDQYHSDVQGARNVGVYAVLLDRDGLLARYDDVPRIGTLMELPEVVAQLQRRS